LKIVHQLTLILTTFYPLPSTARATSISSRPAELRDRRCDLIKTGKPALHWRALL
jgi:hypothetical protein